MSEATITIPVSEYDRLRQIEREAHPLHSRIYAEDDHITSDGLLKFAKPVTLCGGPYQRETICKNCGKDFWLKDELGDWLCGNCGLYSLK